MQYSMRNYKTNHDGELPDGVAEKFIDWAKEEKLSFWR
jgi:hypothetical protein